MLTRRGIAVTLLIIIAVGAAAIPASANYDCQDPQITWLCPEGANQRYYWASSVAPNWANQLNAARLEDIEPSDINTSLVTNHSNSDIHVEQGNYGPNVAYGQTSCQDPDTGADICRHWHVLINTYDPPGDGESTPYSLAHRKYVSCHELGHTAGLAHHNSNNPDDPSCMYTSNALHNPNLNGHDNSHINGIV